MKKLNYIYSKFLLFISVIFFIASILVYPGCLEKKPKPVTNNPDSTVVKKIQKVDVLKYDRKFNDLARFLGGISLNDTLSPIKDLFKNPVWVAHKKDFDENWTKLRTDRLDAVIKWRDQELAEMNKNGKTVFYPFSGPDFLFANTFFPNVSTYIMQGLENVYTVPDVLSFSNSNLQHYLQQMQGSLRIIYKGGYFITFEMNRDFNTGLLRGVVPILMLFMARTDNIVLDIKYILPDGKGNFNMNPDAMLDAQAASKHNGRLAGVMIKFTDSKQEEVKTVYYFSTDMQNPAFNQLTALKSLVTDGKPVITFTKAASYLMHGKPFEAVKDFVLDNSDYMLQTDTGMPLKFFDQNKWDLTFYGIYTRPIDTFHYTYQPDLVKIYKDSSKVKPLPFGIDYTWEKGKSNMMTAVKKKK